MCEMDNFEKIINEDSFLKNIKRMFIMKQIEYLHIKEVVINFDNSTKSLKIIINKDDKNIYQKEYKIKRKNKKSKLKDDRHCKKRKINNKFEDNDKHINSSTHNFINKISVRPEYILNKNSFNNNSYNIKEIKDSECIKLILKDIENVFKNYGF